MAKAKTTGNGNGKVAKEVRSCPVKLTEPERIKRGDEMAACEVKIEALKGDRATTGRAIREQEKRRNELGHMLEVGVEQRELSCEWIPDYQKNVFNLTRPDTREVVDTRAMTATDRQDNLFVVETVDLGPENMGDITPPPPPPRSPKSDAKPKRARKRSTAASEASAS